MVRTPLNPGRPGVTLTEVLVAMFVMAIGMISLLTLFPLGAMQVGQALRDDRCTQLARQFDSYVRQTWRTDVIANNGNNEGYFWAMDDPYLVVKYNTSASSANGGSIMRFVGSSVSSNSWYNNSALTILPFTVFGPAANSPTNNSPTPYTLTGEAVRPTPGAVTLTSPNELFVQQSGAVATGASYPVLLDPAGLNAHGATDLDRGWVGQRPPPGGFPAHPNGLRIPRRTCQLVNPINPFTPGTPSAAGAVSAFELTSLTDDMTYAPNGAPAAGELGRQGRYSCAAVVQRPRNDARTVADLTVLVYDSRSALPQPGDELVVVPDATAAAGSRTVTITLPNRTGDTSPVLLRRGGWLIDGTVDSVSPFRRQFTAYRVSGFTEVTVGTTTTQYDVDLESPLKANLTPVPTAAGDPPASQLYLFAGLIEVFTRPQLRPDTPY